MPKYIVIVSDKAKHMLGTHIKFMKRVNASAAAQTKKRIVEAIRSLSDNPQKFPFFDSPYIQPNQYHRMFVEKWYLVLYQIKDNTVYVDYIVDCRQDCGWLLQ